MGEKALSLRLWGQALLPPQASRPRLLAQAARKALLSPRGKKPAGARAAARAEGEVNVIFVSRARMLKLNAQFLKHGGDTDVIAFGYEDGPAFGDVFVSAFMVLRQARALGHSPLKEALTLVVHGCLHLRGYDDHRPKDKALMFRRQDAVLKSLKL